MGVYSIRMFEKNHKRLCKNGKSQRETGSFGELVISTDLGGATVNDIDGNIDVTTFDTIFGGIGNFAVINDFL